MKVLCVAEKPSISKAVAGHLSGGQFQTVSATHLITESPATSFRDANNSLFHISTTRAINT
jgi:DNA topoisomerase IA